MTSNRNRSIQQFSPLALFSSVAAVLTLSIVCDFSYGEEIQINENSSEMVAGDFRCKPCYRPIINDAGSFEMSTESLTTGDLYRYFASRGITKIDRLSLQIDVDCSPEDDQAFQLNQLDFKITGDDNTILNQASLQNDSLLVAGTEISSYKPEAILEIDLGYDFMERFSSDSTDSIVLNYAQTASDGAMKPRFVVSEDISSFSVSNIGILFLFVSFWVTVFVVMNFFVKPSDETLPPKSSNLVGN